MKPSNEIIDQIIPAVAANLRQSECLVPVFFIGNADQVGIFPADMSTNEAKSETAQAVRAIIQKTNADFVLMVAESWLYKEERDKAEDLDTIMADGLANNPKAKEVVLLRYETPTEAWVAMVDILPQRVLGEVVWNTVQMDEEKGRFTGFFERQSVH